MIKYLHLLLFLFFTVLLHSQDVPTPNSNSKTTTTNSIYKVAAYPNPFNVESQIGFTSTTSQLIIFEVKNILGKSIYKKRLYAKRGENTILFQKNNLASGMYIYSIQTNSKTISKRLVIK